jgi:hypothetical protein
LESQAEGPAKTSRWHQRHDIPVRNKAGQNPTAIVSSFKRENSFLNCSRIIIHDDGASVLWPSRCSFHLWPSSGCLLALRVTSS